MIFKLFWVLKAFVNIKWYADAQHTKQRREELLWRDRVEIGDELSRLFFQPPIPLEGNCTKPWDARGKHLKPVATAMACELGS